MKYLTLIRHGQTTGDVENRFGGDYEDHLTKLGKDQSRQLAEELAPLHIDKFFISPRLRAQETATILNTFMEIEGSIDVHLRERNAYGILTGMTHQEAQEKHPEEYELIKDYKNCIEGAESYEKFKFRVEGVYNKVGTVDLDHVALLTHSGVIRCMFREVFQFGEIKEIGDCSWATIDLETHKIVNLTRIKL
jgi:broad specificity phosphatase PhoE